MVVGPLQTQRPQHAVEAFLAPPGLPGPGATIDTSPSRFIAVAQIGVEVVLNDPPGDGQRNPAGMRLQRAEVDQAAIPDQPFEFDLDLGLERFLEPPFSACAGSEEALFIRNRASHICVLTSMNSAPRSLK